MDNRQIDLRLEGRVDFELAMKLAMSNNKTVGYKIVKGHLALYWAECDGIEKLPYQMNIGQTIDFVWGWLENNPPPKPQPDHDGDNGHGFHIYNESWGHVDGHWQAFIAIEPIWAMYGK